MSKFLKIRIVKEIYRRHRAFAAGTVLIGRWSENQAIKTPFRHPVDGGGDTFFAPNAFDFLNLRRGEYEVLGEVELSDDVAKSHDLRGKFRDIVVSREEALEHMFPGDSASQGVSGLRFDDPGKKYTIRVYE